MHARIIDNQFVVPDLGKPRRNLAAALQEKAVAHLHDVGFVDGRDLLSPLAPRPFERRPRDTHRRILRDDLEALHHAWNHLVLQPRVQILRVLAENRQVEVEVRVPCLQPRQHTHGTEVYVKPQFLPQRDVDAFMSAADGRRRRTLQPDAAHFERGIQIVRNQRPVDRQGPLARVDAFPLDGCACRFDGARGGFRYFRSNSISGDQRNSVRDTTRL